MKRLVLLICLVLIPWQLYSADIIHSAGSKVALHSNNVRLLTHIFTRKQTTWTFNGEQIVVFVKPINSIEHKLFVFEWLRMTNYRFKKLLQQNTFSGVAASVKIIKSDEQMMLVVSTTPNSIGYVGNAMVMNNDSTITIITNND